MVLPCSPPSWSIWLGAVVNDLSKTKLQHQLAGSTFQGWGRFLQEAICAPNGLWCCFFHRQFLQISGWKWEWHPAYPLAKLSLSVPMTVSSSGQEVFVPMGGTTPLGDTTMILLNWKLRLSPGHFELLVVLNQPVNICDWGNWSWLLRGIWTAVPQWM